ncbi:GNAT family N-acetyltransferase [Nocardioides coralli]|uniref:GNAT family N-acetyltransferase n=1 Tax=Nocardioides coralli TaxID=2872154 RepID=UPI001CA3DF76|nr:GNAT family N-acetyltransferase [Nocardioides coralli]QZY30331.1 GNAT family N-acetyltransferase [Nocardioides coralli]
MELTLEPVTRDNWRAVADIAPRDDQRRFVPALAARYLLLGIYGDTWHNLGAFEGDTAVGHVMWGVDDEDGSCWIGGLVVDRAHQGRGVGRRVVELLLEQLREQAGVVRMSYLPDNTASRTLFASLGFVDTDEWDDDERIMELLS